jgi:hypothetical protein
VTLFALTSAKHSPGVSTLAAALAALTAEHNPALLLEADPSGGDLAARAGLRLEPGLSTLAGAARHGLLPGLLNQHLQALGSGAGALVAPTNPEHAASALRSLGGRLPLAIASSDATAFADLGRWSNDHPAADLLHAADAVVVLITPTVEGVEHARSRLAAMHVEPSLLMVVAVGDRPYGTEEIGRALGGPVMAIEVDRRSAETVAAGFALDRWLRRSPLLRSARSVLDRLGSRPPAYPAEVAR